MNVIDREASYRQMTTRKGHFCEGKVMENQIVLPVGISQSEEEVEQALVERAKTNSAAFAVLYERYVTHVYHYLRTRARTDEDAKDLTQQVFLKAFAALPRYRARGIPFKAWLRTPIGVMKSMSHGICYLKHCMLSRSKIQKPS